MTNTFASPAVGEQRERANGHRSVRTAQAPLPRSVRPPMIALAVTMVAVAVLGSVLLFRGATHQRQVLAVAVTVPQGQQVTAADLRTTGISGGAGLTTLPASAVQHVEGEYATTTLTPGTLLTAGDLTAQNVPAPGQILVPVQLKAGQLPARGLPPGVNVVVTPVPGQSSASNPQPSLAGPVQATAEETSQPDPDGMITVDLLVSAQFATQVAAQASTGSIALLVAPQGSQG